MGHISSKKVGLRRAYAGHAVEVRKGRRTPNAREGGEPRPVGQKAPLSIRHRRGEENRRRRGSGRQPCATEGKGVRLDGEGGMD